jgi:deoxyribodipyrimidine photo-lyase
MPVEGADGSGRVSVVLFTRDLRVNDNPTLHQAVASADAVVPLFVVDPSIVDGPFGAPNRLAFLEESLEDLRGQLRARRGELLVVRGDTVDVVSGVVTQWRASRVYVARDVTAHAQARTRRLVEAGRHTGFALVECDSLSVVPPGVLRPKHRDHYRVFAPYFRAWSDAVWRPAVPAPRRVSVPTGLPGTTLPALRHGGTSPHRPHGGERAGRARWRRWADSRLAEYDDGHDDLAGDRTSRLSPYLHFGCLSALEMTRAAARQPGGAPFVRQLAWRDFFLQVMRAFPALPRANYRPRSSRWQRDEAAFRAWTDSRTGVPLVDAGMRQLRREGWMHPQRQARRFDPNGTYVARYSA